MHLEDSRCACKLPIEQWTVQDIFTTQETPPAQSFPGMWKADTLGRLSMDLGLPQTASDFHQKTAVYIVSQCVQTLEAGRRQQQLSAHLNT